MSIQDVDRYIASFPAETQASLGTLRDAIREALPDADQAISYGIPVFRVDSRYVVYFAGWKRHLSMYPIPDGDGDLEERLAPYRAGKGTLRFDLGEPIPVDLVKDVTLALLQQQRAGLG